MEMERAQKPYKRYGAAIKAWRSSRREVLMAGPANTGKSRLWLEKIHFCADKYPRMRGLIVRKTRHSLTQSAMVTYETKVLPDGVLGSRIRWNTQDQQYEYPNGSIIAVGGMDKSSKVMSSEWDFIYVQEATELTEENWEALTIRARNHVMPYQQVGADCNPDVPTHWLKLRCDAGKTLLLESRHEDNPSITPEDMAALDALSGVYYLRYRKGIWAAAEGMVYDEWNTQTHRATLAQLVALGILTERELPGKAVKRCVAGVDWGYTNPGILHVWAVDGDGRLYLIHEVYQTQRTDDWWVEQGRALRARYGIDLFICDPAEPAYIAKFHAAGLPAVEAINDIAPGVSAMQTCLRVAGDGRPRLMLYEYALKERDEARVASKQPYGFESEIVGYVWPKAQDGKVVKEVPVKLNDHAMDAARYVCMWLSDPSRNPAHHIASLQARVKAQAAALAVPTPADTWREPVREKAFWE